MLFSHPLLISSLPPLFLTFPSLCQCVTNQGAQSQAVGLRSDKQDGPKGVGGDRDASKGGTDILEISGNWIKQEKITGI